MTEPTPRPTWPDECTACGRPGLVVISERPVVVHGTRWCPLPPRVATERLTAIAGRAA